MGDKSKINWTDATKIIDREGRRVRYYFKKNPCVPGQQIRKAMAINGLKWCRECRDWLPIDKVTKNGLCRQHENSYYRKRYAKNPMAIRARVHARKRNIDPIPKDADLIAELFENKCAYCDGPHESWDHIIPISRGGKTEPGNIVPSCKRCNSSKNNKPLYKWVESKKKMTAYLAEYLMKFNKEALYAD